MTKSKLTLIAGAAALFGVAVFIINSQPEQQPFQSVELGIAEVSPLGASGGYAIPASGKGSKGHLGEDIKTGGSL